MTELQAVAKDEACGARVPFVERPDRGEHPMSDDNPMELLRA